MDSFTFNKIAGAVLGTCLVGMGIGIVGDAIYSPSAPKKPGYALPEPKPEAEAGAKKPAEVPLPVLLAKADAKKGENDAKVCGACHNFAEGAGAKVGPDLYGVVDRPKGSAPGFDYSAGMKAKGGNWTFADINQFITKPSAYVSGTKMGYPGEENPEKRADIIAYLDTLSKTPVPLPKPTPEEEKVAQGGAAAGAPAGGKEAGGDDIVKLIAASDPKKGESDAKVCTACHNFKEGGGTLVGPDLYGVVDRDKGSVAGFDYSAGLKAKGGKWTYEDLNTWLINPAAYIKGTKMGYPGEKDEKKRAAIIAYLRTLAKTPAPLPAGAAADKAEAKPTGEDAKAEKKAEATSVMPAPVAAPAASAEKPAAPAGGGDFVKLVAAADPTKGKSDAQVCSACHNLKKGGGTLVGPPLWGVVDRDKGSVPGFAYSAGLKAKGGKWTYDDLNTWLTDPAAYIKGTKMGYAGEPDEKKRAAIVAYLRTLADTPAPLPGAAEPAKPEPAAEKAPAPAPAPEAKPAPAPEAAKPAPEAKPAAEPAPARRGKARPGARACQA